MRFVVAVTGGVASGKSAVTRRFEALGVEVHDADVVAREVVQPGTPALAEIAAHFGDLVIAPDGSLDRRAMRERVFADPEARLALEGIIHPQVRAVLKQRALAEPPVGAAHGCDRGVPLQAGSRGGPGGDAQAGTGAAGQSAVAAMGSSYRGVSGGGAAYVIVAVPLLAESSGDWSWVDRVLVVDVPRAVQHARLVARDGVDAAAADAMIAAQATRVQRLAIADDVVVNDGALQALDRAVATLHARYGALAAALL